MTVHYLKRATTDTRLRDPETTELVARMLRDIEERREDAVLEYARALDHWNGSPVVDREALCGVDTELAETVKADILFARDHIREFARRQREAIQELEFEVDLLNGMIVGQKLVPVNTAGCYVPTGRYAHIASALMSIITAKAAGVQNVVAAAPPFNEHGIHPAILYTMRLSGADYMLTLGGVQSVATLAFGLFTDMPANVIVGGGNRFVAEAKLQLSERVGIEVFAGPSEVMVIADATADPEIVAWDLAAQGEHGPDTTLWLVTTSEPLAQKVMDRIPQIIATLPDRCREGAEAAWRGRGEVILVATKEEACAFADETAPEHLAIQAARPEWWLANLQNYGSLYLGEESAIPYGDKCAGPNHILPTNGAAKYSGGLTVGKFIKTLSYQKVGRESSRHLAPVAARLSRLEGMVGHARAVEERLAKYFPGEVFDIDADT